MSNDDATHDDCSYCPLPASRRAFLRDSLLAVAGALIAVGATDSAAMAAPLRMIAGRRRADQTVKYPIPAADGVQIDKDNQVILVRWQNAAYAFNLSCPHQNTALHWQEQDKQFQCPKHHSKYRPDGTFVEGRATRGMDRYAVSNTATGVVVDLDKVYTQDADEAQWTGALIHV